MILVALLAVVLVAAAVAGLLGIGLLSDVHRRDRSGLLAALSAPVVLGVGIVLLAVMVLGFRGGPGHEQEPERPADAAPATTSVDRPQAAGTTTLPSARVERARAEVPVVVIRPADEDRFSAYRPVSGLAPGSVVRVQAEGYEWMERGRIEQCVTELGRQTACAEPFPVQFDDRGHADFQIAVRGDVAPGGCRLGQPTCVLRLTGDQSGRRGTAQTVLVDRLTLGEVRVEPAKALHDNQQVQVSVTGFPAGASATAVLCAPPEAYDARRCAPPSPASTFVVDAGGSGRTTLVVAAGRLGPDAALCGPRRLCGVAVLVGGGFVVAPTAPVAFSLGPGVAYDAGRLVPGVLVALALAGAAVVLAVRTDWARPTEAATPELDVANLRADQDLDELFGTDAEIDERDPIPW